MGFGSRYHADQVHDNTACLASAGTAVITVGNVTKGKRAPGGLEIDAGVNPGGCTQAGSGVLGSLVGAEDCFT